MGLTNLLSLQSLALDTNIFISASNEKSPKNEQTRSLLEQIQNIAPQVFISVVLLEEFFVKIYKQKQEKNVEAILDFITIRGLCNIVNVNREIALTAAKLRAQYPSLRAPDAIHLASAIESKAKVFFTTDKGLPKKIGKLEIKTI